MPESTAPSLPKLDRRIPKFGVFVVSTIFYGVFLPLHWILSRLGFSAALVKMINRGQRPGKVEKVFRNYEPTIHDVFVSTFSKSGTNWMMQIAHQIAFRGAGDYAHIHDVVCWPDLGKKGSRRVAIPLDDTRVQACSPTGLRVIKTHMSLDHVPYGEKAHYLVVIRDPKELFVSSYFFVAGVSGPLMPTLDVWLELFFTKQFPMNFGSTWAEHTAGYWSLRNKPNVLVRLFRDMKQDHAGAVKQVAEFLDVQLTDEELAAVIHKSTFSYMQTIENKFTPIPKGTLPWGEGLKMMREGKSGNSRELLTIEQQRSIDAHCQAELASLGSDFPYAEFFALRDTAVGESRTMPA